MSRVRQVELAPVSAPAFAPFGQIIGQQEDGPVFSGPHIASWRMAFAVDGDIELMFARYRHQAFHFARLERHFNVTQSFIALGGAASVMVVAPPTDPDGPQATPAPDAIRAFFVGGEVGILLWKGTWHALTRFPAHPRGADFALITGRETQLELQRQLADGTQPRHTEVVDFEANAGITFEVVDPLGLIDPGP